MNRVAITLALVGAGTIGLASTSHAMTLPAPSALKEAVPTNASQVFWRGGGWRGGGGWGPGIGFGIAAGALTAAAVASSPYWGGGGYWGGYPGYAYAPAYRYGYAPAYSYAYAPSYYDDYAPASSYAYAPAYGYARAYSYGTRYVSPRRYAYGGVASRFRYANTSAYGVRTYGSGPRYRAIGSRGTVRAVNRYR